MSERMRKELGERIRVLRERQGISQAVFASMIAMDRGYLSGVELGRRNPSLEKLESIANGLDVSMSYLMRGVCEDVSEDDVPESGYAYYYARRK